MRKFKLLLFGLMLLLAGSVQSQLSINVHLGTVPEWGPAGYDDIRYYYLPDVEAYYDVQTSMFIYISGNHWVRRNYLPARYKNYDLYHGYKVVMKDYRGNSPYRYHKEYKMKYAKGYRGEQQRSIGERGNSGHYQKARVHEPKRQNQNQGKSGNGNNNRGHDKRK